MANQIVVSAGAKVRNLDGVLTGTSGVVNSLPINASNGIPQLDVNGKILVSQLPNSVMEYLGTWNAATNTPTLANGTGNQGDVYLCNVAGTVDFGAGPIVFFVGDQVIYSGTIWQRASGATGTVTSVAVTESGDSLNITGSPITTSGTINIGFNGTNLQYVNGAGNLTTFPDLSVYVTLAGSQTITGSKTFNAVLYGTDSEFSGSVLSPIFSVINGTKVVNLQSLATLNRDIYLPDASGTIALTSDIPILTGYVPYTGATANVDLGTFNLTADVITGATGSFASNGGSDTFAINHSSGAGIALNITKGGNGEGLYINKTSGSGNAATIIGTLNATTLVKSGGTSSQFLKADGTVDSSTYALDSAVVHNTGNETIGGTKTFSDATKNNGGIFLQNASSNSLAGYMNIGGLTNGVKFTSGGGISNTFTLPSATGYTFTFPNATGTLALTSDLAGYVPYTGATTNVDLGGNSLYLNNSQAVFGRNLAGSTSYALIGVNASNKVQIDTSALGVVFGGTIGNGTYTYTLPSATGTIALVGGSGVGTVTSVAALTIGTTGTDLSSSVANSTTTPVITLNVPTASATNRGALSSADWTTFNNKQSALTNPVTGTGTTNYLPKFTGASTIGNSSLNDDGTSVAVGIALTANTGNLQVGGTANTSLFAQQGTDTVRMGVRASGRTGIVFDSSNATFTNRMWYIDNVGANGSLTIGRSGLDVLTFSNGGNLGLGVTPSAWESTYKVFQIGTVGSVYQGDASNVSIGNNIYINTSGSARYITNNYSTLQDQYNGQYRWFTAPSGTAGNAITFTQAMTLTAAGRLLIGTPTEATYLLDVNGTGRFSKVNGDSRLIVYQSGATGPYTATLELSSQTLGTYGGLVQYDAGPENLTIQNYGRSASGLSRGDIKFNTKVNNTTLTDVFVLNGYTGAATFSSTCTATGFFESSDSRLKTLIQDNYQTKGIASITPKLYTKNGKVELGYYAQDFVGILDSAVSKGNDDMLSLSYREVLVAKVYALEQRIKELETK